MQQSLSTTHAALAASASLAMAGPAKTTGSTMRAFITSLHMQHLPTKRALVTYYVSPEERICTSLCRALNVVLEFDVLHE